MTRATLIVGLGSDHGDDQAGWRAAERLARIPGAPVVRLARSPCDLLDWLDGVERLVVCDACQPNGVPGAVHRWDWPTDELSRLHSASSHDLGLAQVLSLASCLGRLPPRVVVWGIEIEHCGRHAPLSPSVQKNLPGLVARIQGEF